MLATSEPARQFAQRTFGVDSEVVGLPLQLDAFYGAKPFTRYEHTKNVVFLGRLVERKGCQYLLRAVAYAVKHNMWPADARVIVCGGGPLEALLKSFVRKHALENVVEFTGYISEKDKPRYIASADVAVYPSTGGESFGVVLLEAMAAARGTVLAGDNPGYASVMAPQPASLFDPTDTAAFAQKMVASLGSAIDHRAVHAWQRKYVRQFDVNIVGKRTVDLYEQALHNRPQ
jgi:phosphatidylinositol alpha-mannosyltransferase